MTKGTGGAPVLEVRNRWASCATGSDGFGAVSVRAAPGRSVHERLRYDACRLRRSAMMTTASSSSIVQNKR